MANRDVIHKTEVHNISQRHRRRTEPRPQGICAKNSWRSVQQFQSYARGQTDRQTDSNTPLSYRGGVGLINTASSSYSAYMVNICNVAHLLQAPPNPLHLKSAWNTRKCSMHLSLIYLMAVLTISFQHRHINLQGRHGVSSVRAPTRKALYSAVVLFRPPDIHVGGLIFYHGFFLLLF